MQTEYLKNEDEYLVSGAQLRCSMATSKKMTIEGRTYVPENPSETTYLECEENRMESGGGKVNATTKDCVVYKNIKPFRCNCRVGPCDDEEKDMLLVDESCLTDGTCKALIDLSEHWDNYPSQIPHFRYNDERFGEVSGITMMSMLFCKHGGIITPVTSGQEIVTGRFKKLELSKNPIALSNTTLLPASALRAYTQGDIQQLCKKNGVVYFDEEGYQRVRDTGLESDPYLIAIAQYYWYEAAEVEEIGNQYGFGAVYKVTLSSEKEIYVTQGDVKAEEHTVESKSEEGKNYYAGEGGSANTLEFICNYNNKNSEFFSSNIVNETGTDRNAGKANSIMEGASIIKIELMLDYEIDRESYFKEEE